MIIDMVINFLILRMFDSDTTAHTVKARERYQRRGELDAIYRRVWPSADEMEEFLSTIKTIDMPTQLQQEPQSICSTMYLELLTHLCH